jgi:hypothetical protein
MGRLNSTCTQPHRAAQPAALLGDVRHGRALVVAVQVLNVKANFETRISLYGFKG